MVKTKLYVGLNDKDTKSQEISTLNAYKVLGNILGAELDGYTITESTGFYKHADGSFTTEVSLVVELLNVPQQTILGLIHNIKIALNQECVLMEQHNVLQDYV